MSNDEVGKIIITKEETESARSFSVSQQMSEAEKYALIREVGNASTAPKGGMTARAVLIMAGAGILGGFVAFLGNKVSDGVVNWDDIETWKSNLTFTFIMALTIGLTLVAIDAATQKNLQKLGQSLAIGAPVSAVAGFVFGGIAHLIYSPWTRSIYETAYDRANSGMITSEAEFYDYVSSQLHWARGVAWAIVGVSAGLTVGIASKSMRRALVTTSGGFCGGFLGGFVFDFFSGESSAQVAGMIITGLLIGLAMSAIEQAAKTRWIEIVSGGMAGKQFILYKTDLTIGSSPRADITLIKDPAIPDLAARLVIQGNQAVLESLHGTIPVAVDGQVATRSVLTDGSQLNIGSSVIRYRERTSQGATPIGRPTRLS